MRHEQAKAQLRATGLSGADAAIVTELTEHAVSEALATIKRVIDPAPRHLHRMLLESVIGSLVGLFNGIAPEVVKAIVELEADVPADGLVITVRGERS